ncbi:MAG: Gfo/Idh/MocA family protein [bacterium]
MQQIKLGVIGTGLAAEFLHWPALKQLQAQFRITAVCNRTVAKAIRFAKLVGCTNWYSDYREMLAKEDLEAMFVCTPIFLNYRVSRDCILAGKHVLCEKPPGVNLDEAQKMVELAKTSDRVLMIGENYYYREDLRRAKKIVEAGEIGEPFLIRIATLMKISAEEMWTSRKWRIHPAHRGGIVSDAGVHHMAAFRLLAGEVDEVFAYELDVYPGVQDSDNLFLNLRFTNGVIGQYTACYSAILKSPVPFRTEVYGDRGSVLIDDGVLELFLEGDKASEIIRLGDFDFGFTNQWLDFYQAITNGIEVLGTPARTYKDFELVLKGLESAHQRTPIQMNPTMQQGATP